MEKLTEALQLIDENAARYAMLNLYARGEQPLTFLAPEVRVALNNRLSRVAVNIPGLLVDSLVERLRISGFTGADIKSAWRLNDLDTEAPVAHREALILGTSYVVVWARPDGSPLITVESAEQMAAVVDPATREIVRAVKRWEVPGDGTHATLFEADRITRFKSPGFGATTTGFRVVETIDNPLGVPPVVRLLNGGRLLTGGVSEMADVLPLTDAVVKLSTDMLTASEYGARPRRWATGVELAETAEGEVVSPFAEDDRMLVSEAPESKFGSLPGSDLAGYKGAIDVLMRLISAVSGLPDHMLGLASSNPTSADAIRADEAALTARAEAKAAQFSKGWEQVARLATAVEHGVDPSSVDVRVEWADPSTRSIAQEADAVVKLFAAGLLPVSTALARLGYTDDEIVAIRDARRAEALDSTGVDLTALLS